MRFEESNDPVVKLSIEPSEIGGQRVVAKINGRTISLVEFLIKNNKLCMSRQVILSRDGDVICRTVEGYVGL